MFSKDLLESLKAPQGFLENVSFNMFQESLRRFQVYSQETVEGELMYLKLHLESKVSSQHDL